MFYQNLARKFPGQDAGWASLYTTEARPEMPLKRRIAVSAAAVAAVLSTVVLAGTGHAATVQSADAYPCKIITSAANIRANPNTRSTILGIGYKGQSCTWYSRKAEPDNWYWFYIKMTKSHVTGWVRGDLIEND